jgi:lipopolysaccharide transport system permease protein
MTEPQMTEHPSAANRPVTVVRPGQLWQALDPRTFVLYRFLLFQFTRREIVLRFRQTFIGVLWVVIQPLLTAGLLTVVYAWLRSTDVTAKSTAVAVWAAVGWSLFNGCVSRGTQSILANANLVRKAHFPRYLLPVSACVAVLLDLAVGLCFAVVFTLVRGGGLNLGVFVAVPAMLGLFLFALGFTLATSGVSAKYRDVQYVVPFLLQVLVFVSPIAFGLSSLSNSAQRWLMLNPIAGYLALVRAAASDEPIPGGHVWVSVIGTVVMLVVGMYVFLRSDRSMADAL